jgi:hypothetical protein
MVKNEKEHSEEEKNEILDASETAETIVEE